MSKKRNYNLAKDFPIGTRFMMEAIHQYGMGVVERSLTPVTLISYSKQGDEVVVVETDDGEVHLHNINDLKPADYVDPTDVFVGHIVDIMQNSNKPDHRLTIETNNKNRLIVKNETDNSRYELTIKRL